MLVPVVKENRSDLGEVKIVPTVLCIAQTCKVINALCVKPKTAE